MNPEKPEEVTTPSFRSQASRKESIPPFIPSQAPRVILASFSMKPGKPHDVTVPSLAFHASTKARTPRAPSSKKFAIPETSRFSIQPARLSDIFPLAEENRGWRISDMGGEGARSCGQVAAGTVV